MEDSLHNGVASKPANPPPLNLIELSPSNFCTMSSENGLQETL